MKKAALARQKQVLPAETIPEPSVTITDGMSLVRKMKGNHQTFSQHAYSALTHILHEGVRSHRIDLFFATYREDWIKNVDISNMNIVQNTVPCHRIHQWREFLSSSVNKANLIRFLVVEWKTRKPSDKQLYVSSEVICLHFSNDQLADVAGLRSNLEEADTRTIMHAAHASADGYRAFVVRCDSSHIGD